MKSYFKIFKKVKNQAGATAVIVAITLPMLIGFTALAVDVGYVHVTKNELQNVADAAALAATRKLGSIYQGMTYDAQKTYVCGSGNTDIAVIKGVANTVAYNNKAGGEHIIVYNTTEGINIEEVEIGDWNSDTASFTEKNDQPDAVKVTAHRDNAANGPITTFFAKIFGIDTVNVSAVATAALLGQNTSDPGEIELPLGISTVAAAPDRCDQDIIFSPTNVSCAGWNVFFEKVSNDNRVRTILNGMTSGDIESPATTSGEDEMEFIGGNLSDPTFYELLLLFKDKGYDINANGDPVATDAEGNPITGHLDAATLTTLAADPNVTINGPVVPLFESDGVTQRLYPDGGFDAEDKHIMSTPRNKHLWPTKVVVYYNENDGLVDCANPTGLLPIVGYAVILLTDIIVDTQVDGTINKTINGKLVCELVSNEDTRGGGGEYGTKGSIPCLVE